MKIKIWELIEYTKKNTVLRTQKEEDESDCLHACMYTRSRNNYTQYNEINIYLLALIGEHGSIISLPLQISACLAQIQEAN